MFLEVLFYESHQYFGIDISKDVFDVYDSNSNFHQFSNSLSGLKKLIKLLTPNSHCVMEATGYYHSRLAYFLLDKEIAVSVENPLKIKRFIQMGLSKIKTDKSDAKLIYEYALNQAPASWKGCSKNQQGCLQIVRLLSVYNKQSTQLKNKIHGENTLEILSKLVLQSLKRQLKVLQKER